MEQNIGAGEVVKMWSLVISLTTAKDIIRDHRLSKMQDVHSNLQPGFSKVLRYESVIECWNSKVTQKLLNILVLVHFRKFFRSSFIDSATFNKF